MHTVSPHEALASAWIATHRETLAGHDLVWVLPPGEAHVTVYRLDPDGSEEWIANITRLDSHLNPIVRTSCNHTSWLGKDWSDPVGAQHRGCLAAIAQRLWRKPTRR